MLSVKQENLVVRIKICANISLNLIHFMIMTMYLGYLQFVAVVGTFQLESVAA